MNKIATTLAALKMEAHFMDNPIRAARHRMKVDNANITRLLSGKPGLSPERQAKRLQRVINLANAIAEESTTARDLVMERAELDPSILLLDDDDQETVALDVEDDNDDDDDAEESDDDNDDDDDSV